MYPQAGRAKVAGVSWRCLVESSQRKVIDELVGELLHLREEAVVPMRQ
jgi:hypothetical protein